MFRSQDTSACNTINAVFFYSYGTALLCKRQYTDKTITLRESMYMRASLDNFGISYSKTAISVNILLVLQILGRPVQMTCLPGYMYRKITERTDKTPKSIMGGGGGGGYALATLVQIAHHEREVRSPFRPGSWPAWEPSKQLGFIMLSLWCNVLTVFGEQFCVQVVRRFSTHAHSLVINRFKNVIAHYHEKSQSTDVTPFFFGGRIYRCRIVSMIGDSRYPRGGGGGHLRYRRW